MCILIRCFKRLNETVNRRKKIKNYFKHRHEFNARLCNQTVAIGKNITMNHSYTYRLVGILTDDR